MVKNQTFAMIADEVGQGGVEQVKGLPGLIAAGLQIDQEGAGAGHGDEVTVDAVGQSVVLPDDLVKAGTESAGTQNFVTHIERKPIRIAAFYPQSTHHDMGLTGGKLHMFLYGLLQFIGGG